MRPTPALSSLVDLALQEDLGAGDLTSEALFPARATGQAVFLAKQEMVVAGLEPAAAVFWRLDERCRFRPSVREGTRVRPGRVLAHLSGPLRSLLAGERTALNFLRHLSGVATLTARFVRELRGTGCTLLDTRKTTPGMRALEKSAVRAGGGTNHRLGLFDGVMLKDNHIAAAGSIRRALRQARRRIGPMVKIEVEATRLSQVRQALAAGADVIMLDNMSVPQVRRAVALVGGKAKTEASGRLDLARIRAYARTGVDYLSVGALTHSAPSVDISMELRRR